MSFDGVDGPRRTPPRRPARFETILLVLIVMLAVGLLLMPTSMSGFANLVTYLKASDGAGDGREAQPAMTPCSHI